VQDIVSWHVQVTLKLVCKFLDVKCSSSSYTVFDKEGVTYHI